MQDTAGEVGTNSFATYSCGPLPMDEQRQNDQVEHIYNSSVEIQDIALKTYRERWTIDAVGGEGQGDPCWQCDMMMMMMMMMDMLAILSVVIDITCCFYVLAYSTLIENLKTLGRETSFVFRKYVCLVIYRHVWVSSLNWKVYYIVVFLVYKIVVLKVKFHLGFKEKKSLVLVKLRLYGELSATRKHSRHLQYKYLTIVFRHGIIGSRSTEAPKLIMGSILTRCFMLAVLYRNIWYNFI